MSCKSCSLKKDKSPKGCQNNGTCGTDGCNQFTVFDWLSNMSLPAGQAEFLFTEVRFKNGRKEYYKNSKALSLSIGDVVSTEADVGYDIGVVTLTGELVKVQMNRKKVSFLNDDYKTVYRKSTQNEINKWSDCRDKEETIKVKARRSAIKLKLKMKISDIEFQGDSKKLTFYYTADDRVDFRELIKIYAREFKVKIEMKQIGLRQEASRLGGIGSCGRELCCSTWLSDFRSVSTSAARYQQLSLNPLKLSGQCGKLKCCLNYELGTYMDALSDFPKKNIKLKTKKGVGVCQKTDIFKRQLWYAYEDKWMDWHILTVEEVNIIINLNKENKIPSSLEFFSSFNNTKIENKFNNILANDSINRFDKKKSKRKKHVS